jgi:hypothetical protein
MISRRKPIGIEDGTIRCQSVNHEFLTKSPETEPETHRQWPTTTKDNYRYIEYIVVFIQWVTLQFPVRMNWRIERCGFKNNHTYYQYDFHVQQGFVKLYPPEYIVFWTIRLQLPSISAGRPYITIGQRVTLPLYTTFCIQLGSDELAFICTVRWMWCLTSTTVAHKPPLKTKHVQIT